MTAIRRFLLISLGLGLMLTGTSVFSQEAAPLEPTEETIDLDEVPVLFGAGVSSGFPGFNRFTVQASMQYRYFGMALQAGPTAAGLYFGGTVRGYVPLGGFVPMYVGAGGGVYGESSELHLVIGGHIPVAENIRIDLEAGAARVSAFGTSNWLPWVRAGASYTFPVSVEDMRPGSAAAQTRSSGSRDRSPATCADPDLASLEAAFGRTLRSFVRNGRATYAGTYTDLSYSYEITSINISSSSGQVEISYSGSAQIIGGGRERVSGSASASFEWSGCSWRRTSIDY